MANTKNTVFSNKWNYRFMALAWHISNWSKDPNTKVGCIVVGPDKEIRSQGYNGFPRGVKETAKRQTRPTKYIFCEHAERNAIFNAVLFGASLKGCALYVTMPPCAECARAIIQSGIKTVFFLKRSDGDNVDIANNWRETLKDALHMFNEAGVKYTALDRKILNQNLKKCLD